MVDFGAFNRGGTTAGPEPDGQVEELAEIANRLTLKEKLLEVAKHCAYIRKDGVNQFHKYNYATAAQIFEKVGEALAEQRLVSRPLFQIYGAVEKPNAKGGVEQLVTVEAKLSIHDLDTDDRIECNGFGSGQDNGDKAIMKAQTAALKYAWMMLLNISTGDDPEADATVDSRASGEPIQKKKTPEEYQATVERNKASKLSPLAVELSNQINRELAKEMPSAFEDPDDPGPEPPPEEISADTCKCGAPLVQRVSSKAKGSYPYVTCELSERAFRKESFAIAMMGELAAKGKCGEKEHTWRRIP